MFGQFPNGTAMIYMWPEKDHLKVFPWRGNHIDDTHRVLGLGLDGKLVVAPPGPPFGMPGGMLSINVDPTQRKGGVLFASITRTDDPTQSRGVLRAFDPITLKELWNNSSEVYGCAKFVPPTIAGGRVFLPTCTKPRGEVLVYGR